MSKLPSKICGNCLYYEQGGQGSFCGNKKQTDKKLKAYTYYPFTCGLFKKGIADSRLLYMEKEEKIRRELHDQAMELASKSKFWTTPEERPTKPSNHEKPYQITN